MKHSWLKKIILACLLSSVMTGLSVSQDFTTLAFFNDGASLFSSLTQGTDGNLYGISSNGGGAGYGSIFRITTSGTLTTVYSFCSQAGCADGAFPGGALTVGMNGNFYGTASIGGANNLGLVFEISTAGVFTALHSFGGADGATPNGGLLLGSDGNFYGTTVYGGASNSCLGQCGTVFKMTGSGKITTLHTFDGVDGATPSPVVQGIDGSFYGTTSYGGSSEGCDGESCGTVFKILPTGKFGSLHSFNFSDGGRPYAQLLQASSGAFYGTTFEGGDVGFHGCSNGCGTIFKISSQGAFGEVHKFHGDGGNPESALIQATDGNIYGESPLAGDGEIFKLTLPNSVVAEYDFTASSGGGGNTALVQSTDGKFYGTYGSPGAVFSFDVGLGPFIAFVIPTGKVGATVQILGQGLTGATSVTFNGIPAASFSIVSDTYMTAVVPSGATTGPVSVSTPTGILTSNKNFMVAAK